MMRTIKFLAGVTEADDIRQAITRCLTGLLSKYNCFKDMHNITLIGTIHSENGKCNSDELYKIVESINPEMIFEELPSELFDKFYDENQIPNEPPEVKCIKKYLQNHNIKHIPVDIDVSSNLSTGDINYMFDSFRKYDVYKKLKDKEHLLTAQGGFEYLNSKKCSELFDEMKNIERNLMEFSGINKHVLLQTYKLFYEEQNNREYAMLQNIYNYSKENQYNQAVFFIGCAHRKSIMQKITEYETKETLKLNWAFYNNI